MSPQPFLEHQCKIFIKFWAPTISDLRYQQLLLDLRDYRKHAIAQSNSTGRNPTSYKIAIHKYKKDTTGCDSWKICTLKEMLDVVISDLADADKLSFEMVAQPHQSLLSLNSVLGKLAGGGRTICKTPMLNRVSNLVTDSVSQWEANLAKDCTYDKARKGSSALDAALARGLEAEVAHWLNQDFLSILNDFHKFFDT